MATYHHRFRMAAAASTSKPRVAFVSLGCPKNLVESEKMLGTLADSGMTLVKSDEAADAVVINTCGFLEASKDESLDVIREAVERKNESQGLPSCERQNGIWQRGSGP